MSTLQRVVLGGTPEAHGAREDEAVGFARILLEHVGHVLHLQLVAAVAGGELVCEAREEEALELLVRVLAAAAGLALVEAQAVHGGGGRLRVLLLLGRSHGLA